MLCECQNWLNQDIKNPILAAGSTSSTTKRDDTADVTGDTPCEHKV